MAQTHNVHNMKKVQKLKKVTEKRRSMKRKKYHFLHTHFSLQHEFENSGRTFAGFGTL